MTTQGTTNSQPFSPKTQSIHTIDSVNGLEILTNDGSTYQTGPNPSISDIFQRNRHSYNEKIERKSPESSLRLEHPIELYKVNRSEESQEPEKVFIMDQALNRDMEVKLQLNKIDDLIAKMESTIAECEVVIDKTNASTEEATLALKKQKKSIDSLEKTINRANRSIITDITSLFTFIINYIKSIFVKK